MFARTVLYVYRRTLLLLLCLSLATALALTVFTAGLRWEYQETGPVYKLETVAQGPLPHLSDIEGSYLMTTVSVVDVSLLVHTYRWLVGSDPGVRKAASGTDYDFQISVSQAVAAASELVGDPQGILQSEGVFWSDDRYTLPGESVQILSINGSPISSEEDLRVLAEAATRSPGEALLRVGPRTQQPLRIPDMLEFFSAGGFSTRLVSDDRIQFMVSDVSGASGGLLMGLVTVDGLLPGDLSAGRIVAGTGQLAHTGAVLAVEGVELKIQAAEEAGASVFILPRSLYTPSLMAYAGSMQLVPVATLEEAVAFLCQGSSDSACVTQ